MQTTEFRQGRITDDTCQGRIADDTCRDRITDDARQGRITDIVCDRLELEPEELGERDRFVEEHGADSLALIGVLAALEKEFRVTIDQNEMPRMTHLQGVRQVLAETAGW